MEREHVTHTFPPFYDSRSRILILGSFPSVKSREQGFYYGHPRNRFWELLALLREEEIPRTLPEKRAFLSRNGIALYDVIEECDISGSSDSSIRHVKPADLEVILRSADIRCVFAKGKTAEAMYLKYKRPLTGSDIVGLPSTRPANAAWTVEKLHKKWAVINTWLTE